jgi:dihydroorotase
VNYDTNLKVYPPLRDETSVKELRTAVLKGWVDIIASHHLPHEFDSKTIEFEYAKPGMSSLEIVYAALRTAVPELSPERTVDLLSLRPRQLFGLEQPCIVEGHEAKLTFFDPAGETRQDAATMRSRSKNSPFIGRVLRGQVIGILNRTSLYLNKEQ